MAYHLPTQNFILKKCFTISIIYVIITKIIGEIHEHIFYRQMPCYVCYTTM